MYYCAVALRTFTEISTVEDLQKKCRELCCDLARDMQRDQIKVTLCIYTLT